MQNFVSIHAVLIHRKGRVLVRLTGSGRLVWRSYPLDMPEDEAVQRAAARLFRENNPSDEAHVEQEHKEIKVNLAHSPPPPLRVAWWGWIV